MGESKNDRSARLIGALTAGLAVTALLSSCAGLTGAPGAVAPSTSATPVAVEASTPAPTASAADEAPVPSSSASAAEDGRKAVVPFITSATWDAGAGALDIGAIVPVVVERAGTCTVTAVQGGTTLTATGDAVATGSYTGCPQLVVGAGKVVSGDWTVTVSYDSDDSAGTSEARTVSAG